MGLPTLNLIVPSSLKISHGIYAGQIRVDQSDYSGAFHFGPIPTFSETKEVLEVFVLDKLFTNKPQNISFSLVKKIRSIEKFDSKTSLVSQIKKDISQTRKILETE